MTDSSPADPIAEHRRAAAVRAVDLVESDMVVGLGTGRTAIFALRRLAELIREGRLRGVVGVPTSVAAEAEARRLGIPLLDPLIPRGIDLTIDGADEVDPGLNLIKGAGGALFREKIVAQMSRREVIVVDDSKLVTVLGRHRLPVEVVAFGWRSQLTFLESLGARATLRHGRQGEPFLTDEGNLILDCELGPIADPVGLAERLANRAGVVAHGLFLGLATDALVGGEAGVTHLTRP